MTTIRSQSRLALLSLAVLATWSTQIAPSVAIGQETSGRQVVMFGVLATPGGSTMDPKIPAVVAARLRKTLPGHSFRLVKAKSTRLVAGQSMGLDLGGGFTTKAKLVTPLDGNGKVQMRFDLSLDGFSQFQSVVTTPADQFNFFDKTLLDNSHLLIGVGAR
jgi:hypothetical protein